jgi:hypothetical protein
MTPQTHFSKDPNAIIDYTVRWRDWMASGDAIQSSEWILPTNSTLVKVSEAFIATGTFDAIIFLASGTVGQIYQITNRITTTGGRQNDQTISILIEEK